MSYSVVAVHSANTANGDELTENNCLVRPGTTFQAVSSDELTVVDTEISNVLNSLLKLYSANEALVGITFPESYILCGNFQTVVNFGKFLHPVLDQHLMKDYENTYLLSYFLIQQEGEYVGYYDDTILSLSETIQHIQNISTLSDSSANLTIPSNSFPLLPGTNLKAIPLALYNRNFFWHDGNSPGCLKDLNEIKVLQDLFISNRNFVKDLLLRIKSFLTLIGPPVQTQVQNIKCNSSSFVNTYSKFKNHSPIIASLFYSSLDSSKYTNILLGGNNCKVQMELQNYILFLKATNSPITERIKRSNVIDYFFNEDNIEKLIRDSGKYNKIFHIINHNENVLNSNFNKMGAWAHSISILEGNLTNSVQIIQNTLHTLLADRFVNMQINHLKSKYVFLLNLGKSSHLNLLTIDMRLQNIFDTLLSQDSSHCIIKDSIICHKGRPVFRIYQKKIFAIQNSYKLKKVNVFYIECLPLDNNKRFVGHGKQFTLENGIYTDISSKMYFVSQCLEKSALCNSMYVNTSPNIFNSCFYISSLNNIFIKCARKMQIHFADLTHLLVEKDIITKISLSLFPLTCNNITIQLSDIQILNHNIFEDSYFLQHAYHDVENVDLENIIIHENNIESPVNDFNFTSIDGNDLRSWVLPESLTFRPFLTWGTIIIIIFIATFCCLSCCFSAIRNCIMKTCCYLPNKMRSCFNRQANENLENQDNNVTFVENNLARIKSALSQNPNLFSNLGRSNLKRYFSSQDMRITKKKDPATAPEMNEQEMSLLSNKQQQPQQTIVTHASVH